MAFKPRLYLGTTYYGGPIVQVYPDTDTTVNAWLSSLGGSLFTPLGDNNDTTYDYTNSASVFVVRVHPVTDPQNTGGHTIKFRGSSTNGASFKLSLYAGDPGSGGTLISEFTQVLNSTLQTYSWLIPNTAIAMLHSSAYYGGLYLRGEAL